MPKNKFNKQGLFLNEGVFRRGFANLVQTDMQPTSGKRHRKLSRCTKRLSETINNSLIPLITHKFKKSLHSVARGHKA